MMYVFVELHAICLDHLLKIDVSSPSGILKGFVQHLKDPHYYIGMVTVMYLHDSILSSRYCIQILLYIFCVCEVASTSWLCANLCGFPVAI